jgi:hypothetical protein
MSPVHALFPDVDDRTFAIAFVSLFMQITGYLQTPYVFGPSWSPFETLGNIFITPATEKGMEVTKSLAEKVEKNPQEDSISDDDAIKNKKSKSKKSKSKQKAS